MEHENKNAATNAISYPYTAGTTNTAGALNRMREAMYTEPMGDRPGVRNVGIVITDGESNDRDQTFVEAVLSRNEGIELIAVAIDIKVSI